MAKIDAFFKLMHDQGASDLHLISGQPPVLRIRGDMERVKYKVLDNDELKTMIYEIAPEDKVKVFEETGDVDFGYEIPGLARYRANFFMQKYGAAVGFQRDPCKYNDRRTAWASSCYNKAGFASTRSGSCDRANRKRKVDHTCCNN